MSHPYTDDTTPVTPGEEMNTKPENTPEDLQQLRDRGIQLWEERGLTRPSAMSPRQCEASCPDFQWGSGQIPEELLLVDDNGLQRPGHQPPGPAVVFCEPTTETNGER